MASDLLHLLLLEGLEAEPRLQADLRALLRAERRWVRAGAVLVDLPYFDGFVRRALDDLRGRPDRTSYWGDRFHREGAEHLVGALLRRAERTERPESMVALALGVHSHVLLDVATHPHVNRAALEVASRTGARTEAAHRSVENAQVELWHRAQRKRRLFGDPRTLGLLAVRADGLGRGAIGAAVADAATEIFGWAPGPLDWHRWCLGLWEYALAASGPAGLLQVNARMLRAHRPWFDGAQLDFARLIEGVREQLIADFAELFAHFRTGRLAPAVFHARFPERNLDFPDQPAGQPLAL